MDFFENFGKYVKAFDEAAKSLSRAGFLLKEDEKDLTGKGKMKPQVNLYAKLPSGTVFNSEESNDVNV